MVAAIGHEPVLRVESVTKRFGGLTAVHDVSFEVHRNQICGLIGPNGAGKTTVFNLITGVFPVTSGAIHFRDVELSQLRPHDITRIGVARTFQNIRLFKSMSVLENVLLAQNFRVGGVRSLLPFRRREEEEYHAEAEKLLRLIDLWDKRHRRAAQLPYGDQRRLEIARALATRPALLLLDEPAAGMNPSESEELIRELLRIRDLGVAILLIEHDMRVVMRVCDYVIVQNFGEKIAAGTPAEIQQDPQVVEAYLGSEE